MIVLETERDRVLQEMVIRRFVALSEKNLEIIGSTERSSTDYYLAENGKVVYLVDVKTRKESAEKVMSYPKGLLCRERKIREFKELGYLLNVRTFLVFAFDDGQGDMYLVEPEHISGLVAEAPPRRRKYRGEIFEDLEEVVYLDWGTHLKRIN